MAVVIGAVLSFAGLALDSGLAYTQQRRQQTATDLAALAAATQLSNAGPAAGAAVASNGFAAEDVASVETGTYVADPAVPASQRFVSSGSGSINAVRVTVRKIHHYLFGAVMGAVAGGTGVTDAPIVTRSIAAARGLATFSLGSGVASLDGGIANAILGALVGSSLTLSANDYQALANTDVSLFGFSNALASRAGLTAGTYDALAGTTVSLPAAVRAIADAAPVSGASAALGMVAAALGGRSATLKVGSLIGYGDDGALALGSSGPAHASANALGLLVAMLEAADGTTPISTALNVTLPGVLGATLTLSVGAPAVSADQVMVGAQGATLVTAQTRMRLQLNLAGPSLLPVFRLPLELDLAPARASLSAVDCTGGSAAASATLVVTPGLASAYVGVVADMDLANMTAGLVPTVAGLTVGWGVIQVSAQGAAAIANPQATSLLFGPADIANGTRKTTGTTDYLTPLLSSLFSSLQLNVSGPGITPAFNTALLGSLVNEVGPIDILLSSILKTLGVSVGTATTWVSSVQCGRSVLVN